MPGEGHDADPAALFRHRAAEVGLDVDRVLTHGPLVLTLSRYELTVDDEPVELSPMQVELMAVFMAGPERVWSRHDLDYLIRGRGGGAQRIDVRLTRLRHALRRDLFRSVSGRGWILRPPNQIDES